MGNKDAHQQKDTQADEVFFFAALLPETVAKHNEIEV